MSKKYKQLFIGLGGQGCKSIREIRKVIHERELNVKANKNGGAFDLPCAYLSIDSSPDIKNLKETWIHLGKNLELNVDEFSQLTPNIEVKARNIIPWLYSEDAEIAREQSSVFATIDKATPGAQQRRRYGRALFAANADTVYQAIENAYNRVNQFDTENSCMINVFCSLGGGTGSGGIVDLIQLLRQKFPASASIAGYQSYPLNLYIYMADEDGVNSDDVQGYFFENQYAALRDINALSTGLMHPHTLTSVENSNFHPGERNTSATPINAVIISTNTTSENHRISIEDQIKKVAAWAVDRALIAEGANASAVAKIASGEDFKANTHGEPNDTDDTFVERSYIFSSLGAAKWQAPINELSLMAVHSIMANSFKQMVYNNVTQTEGYLKDALPLDDKEKARYINFSHEDFLMHDYVQQGWITWAAESEEIQNLMTGARDMQALRKMENCFEHTFKNQVLDPNCSTIGDHLSLPGRSSEMMGLLKKRFQMAGSAATSVADLLNDYLMRELLRNWKEGHIGLKQAQEVVKYAAESANACVKKLREILAQKQDDAEELRKLELSRKTRSNSNDGEWFKLTPLSHKLKAKQFLAAHLEDLISIYTIRTQCGHIAKFIEQIEIYEDTLAKFIGRLDTPINCLVRSIKIEEDLYTNAPLYRFIVKGDKPGLHEELLYDYDSQDPKVMDVIKFINGRNMPGKPISVVSNAEKLRTLVAESITGGSTLAHLFGGNKAMNQLTEEALTSTSYELAGKMLEAADKTCGTSLMGGIVSRIDNMTAAEFNAKFKRLMTSAAYSYLKDDKTPTPSNGYGIVNAYRKAWIVSFPANINLPGIANTAQARQDAILAITPGSSAQNVFVNTSEDTTQISVWQTEFARPARTAKVVATVHNKYEEKLKRGRIEDSFWMHIDDLSAEMAAQVTFPNQEDLSVLCDAALWIVRNCEGAFEVDEDSGCIYRNGSTDQRSIFNIRAHKVSELDITTFIYDVQRHLRNAIRKNPELIKTVKAKYEESLQNTQRGSEERATMTAMINKFIKPTLFRIALKEGIKGVYSM